MRQKNASPRREHGEIMRKNGLSPILWTVMKVQKHFLIVRHRITGTVKTIQKEGVAEWAQQ